MVEWFAAGETQVANALRLRGVPQSGSALDLGSIELVQADMRGFVSKECLARNFDATTSHKAPDGSLLFQRHAIRDDWTRVSNEWTVVTSAQTRSFAFSLRVYSGRELRDLLVRAGFSSVDLYGGLDGRRYGLEAERLVVVASKQRRDAD